MHKPVCWPRWGDEREMTAAIHHVRLLGWESMASPAAAAGIEFATYPSVPPWPPGLAFEDALEERLMPALLDAGTRDDILARRGQVRARRHGGGLHDGRRTGGGSRARTAECRAAVDPPPNVTVRRVRSARPAAAAHGSRHLPWRSQHHHRGPHCECAAGLHPAGT